MGERRQRSASTGVSRPVAFCFSDARSFSFVEEIVMNVVLMDALTALPPVLFMDGEPTTAPAGSGPFQAVILGFLVLLALFFIFILPAKKHDKQMQKMIKSIKVNDKVLTTGGVIGVVYSIDEAGGEIVLRVDDSNNVKVHFAISSVYFVFDKEAAKKDPEERRETNRKSKSAKS